MTVLKKSSYWNSPKKLIWGKPETKPELKCTFYPKIQKKKIYLTFIPVLIYQIQSFTYLVSSWFTAKYSTGQPDLARKAPPNTVFSASGYASGFELFVEWISKFLSWISKSPGNYFAVFQAWQKPVVQWDFAFGVHSNPPERNRTKVKWKNRKILPHSNSVPVPVPVLSKWAFVRLPCPKKIHPIFSPILHASPCHVHLFERKKTLVEG